MKEIAEADTQSTSPPGIKGAVLPLRDANDHKKKLIRRKASDYSQSLRESFQAAFLLMNVWMGVEFYLWVLQIEVGGMASSSMHPAGIDGWLPIAGLMNLKFWLLTGWMPTIHPAALFLLLAFIGISLLFRKAFCSWLCPIGTISEYLWRGGRKIFHRDLHIPRWLDIPLRGLKYLLLGFFVWAVIEMSVEEIAEFMHSPFGMIADVKMLDFFRFLSLTGLMVIAVLVVASLLIQNAWCRYLCPYGALLGLASLFGPLHIRRDPQACIDCAKCARVCPSWLPVDKLVTIRSVECTGCLACVSVCPAEGALAMSLPAGQVFGTRKRRLMSAWALAMGIALIFSGAVGYAKMTDHWKSHVTNAEYQRIVPHADQAQHPMSY